MQRNTTIKKTLKTSFTCEWIAAGNKGSQNQQGTWTIHDSCASVSLKCCRCCSLVWLFASHKGQIELIVPAHAEERGEKNNGTTSWLGNERAILAASFFFLCLISPYQFIWITIDPNKSHHRRYLYIDNVYQLQRNSFWFDNPSKNNTLHIWYTDKSSDSVEWKLCQISIADFFLIYFLLKFFLMNSLLEHKMKKKKKRTHKYRQ